jgi:hypothetical protein
LTYSTQWKTLVYYDENSASCLKWLSDVTTGRGGCTITIPAGSDAGSVNSRNYWQVGNNCKLYKAHRIVWEIFNTRVKEGFVIDHIDGDTTNNKISNLREVSMEVNMRNLKFNVANTSGVSGVYFRVGTNGRSGRFVAQWSEMDFTVRTKSFSTSVYGDEAYVLACQFRDEMIQSMNNRGAGYTGRNAAQEFAQKLLMILEDKFPESVKAFGLNRG